MKQIYRDIIAKEFRDCVLNTVKRLDKAETNRPFHAALLSDEALFWSRFERSFSTSFGQRVVEEISKIVAIVGGACKSSRQKVTYMQLDSAVDAAIVSHMTSLRMGRSANNWQTTITELSQISHSTKSIEYAVISDLWWFKDGINNYMSIKTVKPNIDQTAVAK